MVYFMEESERQTTCYFEFQRGNWRKEKKHWKEDSIVIDEMVFLDVLCDLFEEVVPKFDCYWVTIVSENQWDSVKKKAMEIGGETLVAVDEADIWVRENFKEHDCFSIIGL